MCAFLRSSIQNSSRPLPPQKHKRREGVSCPKTRPRRAWPFELPSAVGQIGAVALCARGGCGRASNVANAGRSYVMEGVLGGVIEEGDLIYRFFVLL